MALLGLLTLASSLVLITAQAEPLLFSEECCTEKTVGGVNYVQVPGDTTGFDCEKDCVYEDVANPGSRTCFKKDGSDPQPVSCDESVHDSQYVSVSKQSDEIHFETDIGIFCCTLAPPDSQESSESIQCSMNEDRDTSGFSAYEERASFFYSRSTVGEHEWMSLLTLSDFIHCDFSDSSSLSCKSVKTIPPVPVSKTTVPPPDVSVPSFCPPQNKDAITLDYLMHKTDAVYVLGADSVPSFGGSPNNLDAQLKNCSDRCSLCPNCKFWTLSYETNKTTVSKRIKREHVDISECGIRYYTPKTSIFTAKVQYAGLKGNTTGTQGITYVFKKFPSRSADDCNTACKKSQKSGTDCRNWAWDAGLCSLNTYTPTRLIDVSIFLKKPNLISGCIVEACKNLKPIGFGVNNN